MKRVYTLTPLDGSGGYGDGVVYGGHGYYYPPVAQNPSPSIRNTDELPEGRNNLYFTEERVKQVLAKQLGANPNQPSAPMTGVPAAVQVALNDKASNARVDDLETTLTAALANKVSKEELTLGLSKKVSIDDHTNALRNMAPRSELEQLNQDHQSLVASVADKATKANFQEVRSLLASKADSAALTSLTVTEEAHYRELSGKLESKASSENFVALQQTVSELRETVANKASGRDLANTRQQFIDHQSHVDTRVQELDSKLVNRINNMGEDNRRSFEQLEKRINALIIPSTSSLNQQFATKLDKDQYANDRQTDKQVLDSLREMVINDRQTRVDADREIRQALRDAVASAKSEASDAINSRLSNLAQTSYVDNAIRNTSQDIQSQLRAFVLERDTENDLQFQLLKGEVQTRNAETSSRIQSLENRLQERPNRDWIQLQISDAIGRAGGGFGGNYVTRTEFESRLASLSPKVDTGNGTVNLSAYATIDYVNSRLSGLSTPDLSQYARVSTVNDLSLRVSTLESRSQVDTSQFVQRSELEEAKRTLNNEITRQVQGVQGKLTNATTLAAGLMSPTDKAKLDSAMSRQDVVNLLKEVLKIRLDDHDGTLMGYLADISTL